MFVFRFNSISRIFALLPDLSLPAQQGEANPFKQANECVERTADEKSDSLCKRRPEAKRATRAKQATSLRSGEEPVPEDPHSLRTELQ